MSFLRTHPSPNLPKQDLPGPVSELPTCQTTVDLFLSPYSEPAKSGFGPVPSLNYEPAKLGFGWFLSPNLPNQGSILSFFQTPNLLIQGLPHLFLRTPNLPNQGSARSFLRTPSLPNQGFGLFLSPKSEHAEPVLGLVLPPNPNFEPG